MAQRDGAPKASLPAQEQLNILKKKFEVTNFDLNAMLRGAQLTVVGGKLPELLGLDDIEAYHFMSTSSITKSTTFYLRALQAGCLCRRCWNRHQACHRNSGNSIFPLSVKICHLVI